MGNCSFSRAMFPVNFKAAFLVCVGVWRSHFCFCKVVSKNRSVQSCALTFASCIQRSFSKQAYQTRKNSHKPQKSVVENKLFCAPPVKCSSRQTITASSDCLLLVTEVSLSVYMLSLEDAIFTICYQHTSRTGSY